MQNSELRRELGVFDSVMLIVGSTIGIGIFVTTGFIAQQVSSPGIILLVWLLGGLLALAGALSCAELGASLPFAGGDYVYLREAYGPLMGFLSGWASFFVTFSGSAASLAVGFTQFIAFFVPALDRTRVLLNLEILGLSYSLTAASLFSIGIVLLLSLIQVMGIKQGSQLQNILTLLKIGALLFIVLVGLGIGNGRMSHFSPFFDFSQVDHWSALGSAFIPVIFTYAGWNAVIYVAGEVKKPATDLPRSLILANLLVISLYLAINAVYFYGVPVESMQGVVRVAELATTALFGYGTSAWITALIAISILGAMNAIIMTGPRIYYAMARDGIFFFRLTKIHPRFFTPSNAILLQALWTAILILTGTFETLLTYVTVVIVLFSALTVGAVLVLRHTQPGLTRPYHIWGYPWVPILFILANVAIALATLWEKPLESLLGAGIVALGIPAYYIWSKNRGPERT
ncbi:MAG: amino acid permease [Deltaproteobacteria bacterium]|nr:amino acid permease [Deltaproteobacteria bacterium]